MSKPNLPPVPKRIYAMSGIWSHAELEQAIQAYAEEAVRQALAEAAGKLKDLAQEAFERPGVAGTVHMAYHQAAATILSSHPETRDG